MNAPPDAPLVLATGLGPLTSIVLAPDGRLVVGGAGGAWIVSEQGTVDRYAEGPVRAVASHPTRVYLLRAGTLEVRPWGADQAAAWSIDSGDAFDVQATARAGEVWLLHPDRIESVDVLTQARHDIVTGLADARALAWAPDGPWSAGGRVLLLTAATLAAVDDEGRITGVAGALDDAVAVSVGTTRQPFVADARGLRAVPGAAHPLAVHPRDLQAAIRPALPPTAAYLVTDDGLVGLLDLAPAGP